MATKAVFFDWDGTLVDSFALNFQALNATLEHFNMPKATEDEFRSSFASTAHETFTRFFGPDYSQYSEYYYEVKEELAKDFPIEKLKMPNSDALIDDLRKQKEENGLFIGVISNKNESDLLQQITKSGWEDLFDVKIGSTADRDAKPNRLPLDLALEKYPDARAPLGREMLYIGDTDTDHDFAKETGMQFIGVGNAFKTSELNANNHVENLEQLQGRLNHLLGRGSAIGTP